MRWVILCGVVEDIFFVKVIIGFLRPIMEHGRILTRI